MSSAAWLEDPDRGRSPRCREDLLLSPGGEFLLRSQAVASVLLADARRDGGCREEVSLGSRQVGLPPLREPPTKQRVRLLGIETERCIVVGDGLIGLTELQMYKAAAIQRIGVLRPQSKGFIAVGQRRLQVSGKSSGEAPRIPGGCV